MIESKEYKKWYKLIRTISTEERAFLLENKIKEYRKNPSHELSTQISIIKKVMKELGEIVQ